MKQQTFTAGIVEGVGKASAGVPEMHQTRKGKPWYFGKNIRIGKAGRKNNPDTHELVVWISLN